KIPTSQLNDFLVWVHTAHPPISRKKMKIKIKYMVQKKSLPPTFFLFTHSKSPLAPAYRKFLKRLIREQFGFVGSPIRLYMKSN
ncbi:MAG: ribosome biogenesis GTPase Der, partial [Candidatus Aminicenantes bacterium]